MMEAGSYHLHTKKHKYHYWYFHFWNAETSKPQSVRRDPPAELLPELVEALNVPQEVKAKLLSKKPSESQGTIDSLKTEVREFKDASELWEQKYIDEAFLANSYVKDIETAMETIGSLKRQIEKQVLTVPVPEYDIAQLQEWSTLITKRIPFLTRGNRRIEVELLKEIQAFLGDLIHPPDPNLVIKE